MRAHNRTKLGSVRRGYRRVTVENVADTKESGERRDSHTETEERERESEKREG